VENDGSNCLVEAAGQTDHRMHSGELLHHMGRPVVKRTLAVEVEVEVEVLETSGTGSTSRSCGAYQYPRKPEHWSQLGSVKPWMKMVVL
jgi:hypothetical protein